MPALLGKLIDRESAIAEAAALLRDQRLVTLVGPGGCGKTSLAMAVGTVAEAGFPGGVWWVDLGGVLDPTLVAGEFATALGVKPSPGGPLHSVQQHVGDKHVLLIVDNCEQVAAEVATTVEVLLRGCRHLHVLATSRQLLNLSFEYARTVHPLAVTGTREAPDRDCPAVRLFAQRAAAAPLGFHLDASNIGSVWEICRQLEGLPLAIELAAARCRAMSPAEIAAQLAAGYGSLTADHGDVPARHQSLAASLAWSWGLLHGPEQSLLARLSVLPADFGPAAAAAVGDEPEAAVLERLQSLCDQSLVSVITGGQCNRYRLMDAVRAHAAQRLAARGETDATRDRLLEWSIWGAESINRGDADEMIASLEADMPAYRSALDHALQSGAADRGLRLATALRPLWWGRHPEEGVGRMRSLLALEGGGESRTAGLSMGMLLAVLAYDFASAHAWATEALARAGDDQGVRAAASLTLLRLARAGGDVETAYRHLAVATDAYTRLGDLEGLVDCSFADCEMAQLSGDHQRALSAGEAAVRVARQSGQLGLVERALLISGGAAYRRGDLDEAQDSLTEAHEIALRIGEETYAGLVQGWLARVLAVRGRYDEADALVEACFEGARRTGNVLHRAAGTWAHLLNAYESANAELSLGQVEQGAGELAALMYPGLAADLSITATAMARDQGDGAKARALAEEALRLAQLPTGGSAIGRAQLALGNVEAEAGNAGAASDLYHRALESMVQVSDRLGMITLLEELAGLLVARSPQKAQRLFQAAAGERVRLACPVPAARAGTVQGIRQAIEEHVGALGGAEEEPASMSLDAAVALARRGRGPRISQTVGWGSLTPTELRVAACLAEGCSNRAVADRLMMSEGTVKTHVAHIFSKLNVGNRAAVAAIAAAARASVAPQRDG